MILWLSLHISCTTYHTHIVPALLYLQVIHSSSLPPSAVKVRNSDSNIYGLLPLNMLLLLLLLLLLLTHSKINPRIIWLAFISVYYIGSLYPEFLPLNKWDINFCLTNDFQETDSLYEWELGIFLSAAMTIENSCWF